MFKEFPVLIKLVGGEVIIRMGEDIITGEVCDIGLSGRMREKPVRNWPKGIGGRSIIIMVHGEKMRSIMIRSREGFYPRRDAAIRDILRREATVKSSSILVLEESVHG